MRRARRFEITVALAVALWGLAVGSAPAREDPPVEAGVHVADILREADAVKSEIGAVVRASQPGKDVDRIVEKLPEFRIELSRLVAQLASLSPEQLDFRQLAQLEDSMVGLRLRLEGWQRVLGERASRQQAGRESLKRIEASWRGVRDKPGADTVVTVIDETLDLVAAARAEVGDHLAQVLELEGALLEEVEHLRAPLARITAAREQAHDTLIIPEQPPLWRFGDSMNRPLTADVSTGWADLETVLSSFVRDNATDVSIHALLSVGLLVLMFQLNRSIRKRAEQVPALEQPARVLSMPLSAALLVSLLLTRWIYDRPPETVLKTAALLALPPLLLLLSALISKPQRRPLHALGALLLTERVGGLFAEQALLSRLLLFVLAGLGLAGLIWVLRTLRPFADRAGGRLWRASHRIAFIAAVALGIALVANVAGSVALAGLLIEAVFFGTYVGVVFFAGYLVMDAVTLIVLDRAGEGPLRSVGTHAETIHLRVRSLLRIGFVVWWSHAILGFFHVREPVLGLLGKALGRTWTVGSLSLSIGAVLIFLLTVWISVILSRLVSAVLSEDVMTRLTLPRGIPETISRMARYGIVAVGVLAAATAVGIELAQFTIIAGALGVGVGFGLQDLVRNFAAGMILAFERPIHVGDAVETGTVQGMVEKIGLRSSVVRTFEGAEVIVPNGNLISNEVTNWTLSDAMRRMTVAVGVAYGTDPRKVQEILLEAATKHEMVASRPEAHVLFVGFGASSLDFELRFWTSHSDRWLRIWSDVTMNVNDGLAAAGIKIPFPQRDVHLRTALDSPAVSVAPGRPR